jgi:hypothetical protein
MVKASGAVRLLIVVSVVATGLGLGATPVAAVPPTLTVTPATGLLDQQIVTVAGSGFTGDEELVVAQCAGATLDGCVLDPPVNTTASYATAAADGTFSVTLRLSRVLTPAGGDVSCAVADCAIVAATRTEPAERTRTAIDFAATGTAPSPDATLSIAVTDMRARGGRATYTGSGYLPWFRVSFLDFDRPVPISVADAVDPGSAGAYLDLCTTPPSGWAGCERYVSEPRQAFPGSGPFWFTRYMRVRTDGTVSEPRQDLPRMWETDHGRVDCAVEDCSFALEQDGAPHSNVVDVAWLPEWSPWPSATAFVTDAYEALVGRRPTTSERSAALAGLTDRSLTGFTFLRQLAGRSDARPLAELTRLYQAALGRRPDAGGLLYWERELRRLGGNMNAIASAFGRSPEFRQVFGSGSDAQAVTLAYERTLGRTPSGGERSYWVGQLRAGVSRPHMIHLFSRTPEYLDREAGRSQATAITVTLLGRGPTADAWTLLGPDWFGRGDGRTVTQRVDDMVLSVLSVLSSTALRDAVG